MGWTWACRRSKWAYEGWKENRGKVAGLNTKRGSEGERPETKREGGLREMEVEEAKRTQGI